MNVLSRSWELTKASWNVIKQEKELLIFPILGFIFSSLFLIIMLFPFIISVIVSKIFNMGIIFFVAIFGIYFGIAFIATFFNVCIVYTAAIRFSGRNSKLLDAISFAFKKIHLIFVWSIISATVGLFLSILENIAKKEGPIGKIILGITETLIGLAWSIATIFIIPIMVYTNLGPFKAIKKSVEILKKTWGESLIKYLGFGIVEFLFFLVGIFIFFPLIAIGIMKGILPLTITMTLLLFIYFLAIGLFFSLLSKVFDTALYIYAETGRVVPGFNEEIMRNAFKPSRPFLIQHETL